MVILNKVISGGQTGADQAGIFAAAKRGIPTGGNIPKGYRTLKGSNPGLAVFGLIPTESSDYPQRTELNVLESDGTLRIAEKFSTAGEKCTLKYITKYQKPSFDIQVTFSRALYALNINPKYLEAAKQWIIDNNIQVLNVAGNSEETSPGIQEVALEFLIELFTSVNS